MATYKGIQGYSVQKLSEDPSPTSNYIGQMWYNSSSGKFKLSVQGAAAWSAGSDLNTGRRRAGGTGPSSSAILAGGYPPGGAPSVTLTETYNGTAWTEVTNVPLAPGWPGTTNPGFSGTSTAALYISGDQGPSPTNASMIYNGTGWTTVAYRNNSTPTQSIMRCNGCGTTTATLTTAGENIPAPGYVNVTESYNGTAWTELTAYPLTMQGVEIMGTTASAVACGGYPPPASNQGADWDGTSWAVGTVMNTSRSEFGSMHNSPVTDCGVFGGFTGTPGGTVNTELWNGSSWTETSNLGTGRYSVVGGGTTGAGICAGGYSPGTVFLATEEFDNAPVSVKTVTVS